MDRTTAEEIAQWLHPYAALMIYASLPMIYVVLFCIAVWSVMSATGSIVELVRSLGRGFKRESEGYKELKQANPNVIQV
jgi:hypothetical protein